MKQSNNSSKKKISAKELTMHKLLGEHDWAWKDASGLSDVFMDSRQACRICGAVREAPFDSAFIGANWTGGVTNDNGSNALTMSGLNAAYSQFFAHVATPDLTIVSPKVLDIINWKMIYDKKK